jgi:hypothetical protein
VAGDSGIDGSDAGVGGVGFIQFGDDDVKNVNAEPPALNAIISPVATMPGFLSKFMPTIFLKRFIKFGLICLVIIFVNNSAILKSLHFDPFSESPN